MSAAARRAAEAKMARRDRLERGGRRGQRAARRSHMPNFLESDDIEDEEDMHGGLLSGMKRRARRQYDERKDLDDMEGVEDVSCVLHMRSVSLIEFHFTAGTPGTTGRHQSQVHCRMDRERARSAVHRETLQTVPHDIRR